MKCPPPIGLLAATPLLGECGCSKVKELWKLLRHLNFQAGSPRTRSTPSSPSTLPRNQDYKIRSLPRQRLGHSYGDSKGNPSHQGRSLRSDLLHAADNVTNAMSSLVSELTSGKCTGQLIEERGLRMNRNLLSIFPRV